METLAGAFWELSVDMGVYILFGLLAAGVLHQLIDEEWIRKHLGRSSSGSVYKGALFGTPLPLCSCSVIPFAASLRRSGASKGATLSFLISTPITGVDSILATFGMFGWAFALYRLVSSVLLAVAAGLLMNRFERAEPPVKTPSFSVAKPSALSGFGSPVFPAPTAEKKHFSPAEVFRYGFVTLLESFSKPLFWGLAIGALIAAALPESLHSVLGESRWIGYIVAVAIAAPMYVCATASLPIAASLMVAGVSPGAAFIFLSAGPATNTVTMGVVKSMLGMRALIIYLAVILGGSVVFGALIDAAFDSLSASMTVDMDEKHGWIEKVSAAVLLVLLGWHLLAERFRNPKKSCTGGSCCTQGE